MAVVVAEIDFVGIAHRLREWQKFRSKNCPPTGQSADNFTSKLLRNACEVERDGGADNTQSCNKAIHDSPTEHHWPGCPSQNLKNHRAMPKFTTGVILCGHLQPINAFPLSKCGGACGKTQRSPLEPAAELSEARVGTRSKPTGTHGGIWILTGSLGLLAPELTEPAAKPSRTPMEPAANPPEPAAELGTCPDLTRDPAGPSPGSCKRLAGLPKVGHGTRHFLAGSFNKFAHWRTRNPPEPAGTRGGTRVKNVTALQPQAFFDSSNGPGTRRNPLRNPRFLQNVLRHLLVLCLHTVTLLYYY